MNINRNYKVPANLVLLLLGITLIFLCGISSVSAANPSSSIYVSTHGNNSWDGQSATYNSTTKSGPKATILNATGTVKSGGTVYIGNGIYKEHSIIIKSNMKIQGKSWQNTQINAEGLGNIFIIPHGVDLSICNVSCVNGKAFIGGAIENNGTLKLIDCKFENNGATTVGGAIKNTGSLKVEKTLFINNTAMGGGAIDNYGILTINNSTFNYNTAPNGVGGALTNYNELILTNNSFNHNTAWFFGGAIYNSKILKINRNSFTENKATNNGGAIYNHLTGVINIDNSTFNHNQAVTDSGGAVFSTGNSTISNTNFINNFALGDGGSIYNQNMLTVTNSIFKNNSVNNSGGAIFNSKKGTSYISGSKFTNNNANDTGGAIENEGYNGALTVINSDFTSNTGSDGGAVYNDGTATLINSKFTKNHSNRGGALRNNIYGTELVLNCIFNSNYGDLGGAIYTNGNFTVSGSEFNNNTSPNGGAIINYVGLLTVIGSSFLNNTANNGGSIYNFQGTVNLNGNNFTGNRALVNGGAIYNEYGNVNAHFNRIVANNANKGKAIYNNGGKVGAILNWWGYNSMANVKAQFYNTGNGSINYDPWIVLSITASPSIVKSGKSSTITADLLHDNYGVYYGSGVTVPYNYSANFMTTRGNLKNYNFVNGITKTTLNNLNNGEIACVSAKVDGQKVSTSVAVNSLSVKQITAAATNIKKYYELHHDLPVNTLVSDHYISMPQLLELLTTATLNIKKGNLNPIVIPSTDYRYKSVANNKPGQINRPEYLRVAAEIQKYFKSHGTAPKNIKTSLGTVSFKKLVYTYSKILNFYKAQSRLPNYVKL
jgi:predicted outer membrane repeat protein